MRFIDTCKENWPIAVLVLSLTAALYLAFGLLTWWVFNISPSEIWNNS